MEPVEIVMRPASPTIALRARINMLQMAKVMGSSYRAVFEELERRGLKADGAPYARYTGIDWEELAAQGKLAAMLGIFTRKWNVEMGLPLSEPLPPAEGFVAGCLPAGRYVETLHRGPYRKVNAAYERLQNLARQEGLKLGSESIEIYLNDPRTTASAELETLVLIPLLD